MTPESEAVVRRMASDPRGKSIEWGVAFNHLKKLQRDYDKWAPHVRSEGVPPTALCLMARLQCEQIKPLIKAAQQVVAEIEKRLGVRP